MVPDEGVGVGWENRRGGEEKKGCSCVSARCGEVWRGRKEKERMRLRLREMWGEGEEKKKKGCICVSTVRVEGEVWMEVWRERCLGGCLGES